MNPNQQLEAIEKIILKVREKTRGLSSDERDAPFSSVVQALEFMTARSRALYDIEKLLKDNDIYDVDLEPSEHAGRLLEALGKIDPKERFRAMVESGLIDEEGRVKNG